MKRFIALLSVLALSTSLSAGENEEFRATWVVTWEHINAASSVEENKARIREIMDNHKAANMNAVLFQIRQSGTAYYRSSFETWGFYAGYKDPGYDPLAYAVEQAHARGLELHAWMNVFESGSTQPGSAAANHPDWICRDGFGNPMPRHRALSPGLKEVREYLLQVAMEIVTNYDIDGLHLDFIRWNEWTTSSINTVAKAISEEQYLSGYFPTAAQLAELAAADPRDRYLYDKNHPYSAGVPAGYATWEDWWRDSVTKFVRALHDSIQAVKPWVRLSPAALGKYNWSGWNGYSIVFQDAALWFNEGYIDQLCGMHYHWTTPQGFYDMLTGACPQCWRQYIQPGIAAGRLYTVGPSSHILEDKKIWNRHPQIVNRVRDVPWVDGFQFFSYRSWRDQQYWDEARAQFFQRKTKVRGSGLIDDVPPQPPTVFLQKLDSLHYSITVTPPANPGERLWYYVYRSEDDVPEVGSDEIIDIHFGVTGFTTNEAFDGSQDFGGRYTYFATASDRFRNESSPSNAAQTDPIPSFPPKVIASYPAPGDTVPVTGPFSITFLKTMDAGSFAGAVTFDPAAPIASLSWSDDLKTLTISLAADLAYDMDYTLTIDASVTDFSGLPLDGNGDGVPGDAFALQFHTLAKDVFGPRIVDAYPPVDVKAENFDIAEVVTLAFNELINPATLASPAITLFRGASEVPFDLMLAEMNGRSLISVQAQELLDVDTDYTVQLMSSITDALGNPMDANVSIPFHTSPLGYVETLKIDDFTSPGDWKEPGFSGSTTGILGGTEFGFTGKVAVPASRPRKAAFLKYVWDEKATTHLLREFLAGGAPRNVWFDSTYTLQCHIFGDGGGNKFRFALDDGRSGTAAAHEVSQWVTIDWVGWRLVEWELNDPQQVGEWLGNGVLDGGDLRIDSFQLTHEPGAALSGTIYFDNLRLVKKSATPVGVAERAPSVPRAFTLHQNYPNPFNPGTWISFELPADGFVQLVIYDLLGREIAAPVRQRLGAGLHKIYFDGSTLPSGVYMYRLQFAGKSLSRRMTLKK